MHMLTNVRHAYLFNEGLVKTASAPLVGHTHLRIGIRTQTSRQGTKDANRAKAIFYAFLPVCVEFNEAMIWVHYPYHHLFLIGQALQFLGYLEVIERLVVKGKA